jgi:hypothetical protein
MEPSHTAFSRFRALWGRLVGCGVLVGILVPAPRASASLIINEIFQSNQSSREWVEFLVTSDITLGALDSFWFGNTTVNTNAIQTMSRFNSTEIINSFSYFTSTSDIVKAGSLIVVGGTGVTADFTYSPSLLDPLNTSIWNFSLVGGNGITGNTNPFNLDRSSGALWVSSAQPMNTTDVSNFVSAVAYLDTNGALSGGLIADYITNQSLTNGTFQTLHTGAGGGFDGNLGNGRSVANSGTGTSLSFGNSESNNETVGVLNGGLNTTSIGELRAVPEPAAILPLALLVIGGGFVYWRRRTRTQALA